MQINIFKINSVNIFIIMTTNYCLDDIISVTDFSNNIYVIHNLFDDLFCNNMINNINNTELHKTDYSPTNNVQTYSTLLSDIVSDDLLLNRDISLFLTGYVRAISCIINHVNNLIFNSGIPKISEIEIRKVYGATRQHIDGITIHETRLLTCICALNDDYDDGIISFPSNFPLFNQVISQLDISFTLLFMLPAGLIPAIR